MNCMQIKKVKAQSALEYLSAYSWALILIALAILLFFLLTNNFSITTYSPSYCYISSGFPCYQLIVGTNSIGSTVIATFTNDLGKTVYFSQSNTFYVKLLSTAAYTSGKCTPSTVNPGSAITCVAYVTGISPQLGQQLEPQFFFNYSECFSVNCNNQNTATLQKLSTAGSSVSFAYPINTLLQESIIKIPPGGGPPIITPPGGGPGSGSTTTVIGQESTTTISPEFSTTTVTGTGGVTTYIYISSTTTLQSTTTTPQSTTTTPQSTTTTPQSTTTTPQSTTTILPQNNVTAVDVEIEEPIYDNGAYLPGYGYQGAWQSESMDSYPGPQIWNMINSFAVDLPSNNASLFASDGLSLEADAGSAGTLCSISSVGIYGGNTTVTALVSNSTNRTNLGSGSSVTDLCSAILNTPVSLVSLYPSPGTILQHDPKTGVATKVESSTPPNATITSFWERTDPIVTYENTNPYGWWWCGPLSGKANATAVMYASNYGGGMYPLTNLFGVSSPYFGLVAYGVYNSTLWTQTTSYTSSGSNTTNQYTYDSSSPYWCTNGDEAINFLGWSGSAQEASTSPYPSSYSGPSPNFTIKDIQADVIETAHWSKPYVYAYTTSLSGCTSLAPGQTTLPPYTYTLVEGLFEQGQSITGSEPTTCWDQSTGAIAGGTFGAPLISNGYYSPTSECSNTGTISVVANQISAYITTQGYQMILGPNGYEAGYQSGTCGTQITPTTDLSPVEAYMFGMPPP